MDDVSLIISFCRRFVSSMHVELVVVVTLFVRIEHQGRMSSCVLCLHACSSRGECLFPLLLVFY
jgi:hypothetical protein